MSFFSNLFKSGPDVTPAEVARGTLIDVRTPGEFRQGHYPNSVNIPLDQIRLSLDKIKLFNQPIFLCCASGGRGSQAQRWLTNQGVECRNLGGWTDVPR
ncbi:rhodanese-like domain-containing protein [bacterium]|nr:rhodanese-like domain-containing protein [bacterium]